MNVFLLPGGSGNSPSHFMRLKLEISTGLMGHLAGIQTLLKTFAMLLINSLFHSKNDISVLLSYRGTYYLLK